MSQNKVDLDKLILDSFIHFVTSLEKFGDVSTLFLDETIRSYLINTIKHLYDEYKNDNAENEIGDFIEIMDAYINGFKEINEKQILKWLIELGKELDENKYIAKNDSVTCQTEFEKPTITSHVEIEPELEKLTFDDSNLDLIAEMFPDLDRKLILNSFKRTKCHYERTIDELLISRESITTNKSDSSDIPEEERQIFKDTIVKKFGFVADTSNCRPITKWDVDKKLIRYYENKVVTTKGEKYFELKTEQDEEEAKQMKKTFINLKPARKYRFH